MIDLLKKYNVEINRTDFLVERILFDIYKPVNIYEHGTGPAGWCISHNAMSTYDMNFFINDDFSYAELGLTKQYNSNGIFWPNNQRELIEYLENIDDKINYTVVKSFNDVDSIVDLIRIDGAEDDYRPLIDKALETAKFIIADDINPNSGGIERFLTLQEYAAAGLVKFVWAGNKSGLWINNKYDIDLTPFMNAIESSNINYRYKSYKVFNILQEHISTK